MAILFRIFSLLCLAIVVWLLAGSNPPLNRAEMILLPTLLGALSVVFAVWPAWRALKAQKQHSVRTAEKMEVSAENSGEKVRALEAKIKTLEKALDEALSR